MTKKLLFLICALVCANLTAQADDTDSEWTKINTGTYYYAQCFVDTLSGYELYVSNSDETKYKITDWCMGVDFTFTWDGDSILVDDQSTGYEHATYGTIMVCDLTTILGSTDHGTSYYDADSGTFNFFVYYYVEAGYFGYGYETFVLDDPAGVKGVTLDAERVSGEPVWYSLSGVNMGAEQPTKAGVYVVRQGGQAKKVLVK